MANQLIVFSTFKHSLDMLFRLLQVSSCNLYRFSVWLVPALVLLLFAGCDSGGIKTYPATVNLRFADGSSTEGTVISFQSVPDPAANNGDKPISAIGKVGPDGTAHMMTREPGDGAVAGKQLVSIAPGIHAAMETGRKTKPQIDSKYRNPKTSGLEVTIDPNGPNEFSLSLD